MKHLKLSKDISLPLDIVTQTIAILAKRRGGKSYTMRKIVEQLLTCNQQVVMVDPKGDQWGIRSSADGKKAGYPIVILGGEHGDAPLEVNSGEIVAKLVVEERVSVLLDLSVFRKHEIATFMGIFLENLYRLKAQEKYRTPVMLVIDEADAIAPQKPQKGEERMLGAAEDIVRRGGQRGIGCALITQRSAVLNKNVLTQAQMLIVLRTIAPQDLAAMKAWIDVHGELEQGKTLMDSLPALPVGDAWFWSPGWPTADGIFQRTHILPIETFDSGATPAPGQKAIVPKNLADVNLDVLKEKMAATIQKAKADNPVELKKRIVELERMNTSLLKNPFQKDITPKEAMEIAKPLLDAQEREFWLERDEWLRQIQNWFSIMKQMAETMQEFTNTKGKSKKKILKYSTVYIPEDRPIIKANPILSKENLKNVPQNSGMTYAKKTDYVYMDGNKVDTDISISGPEQKILDAISWQHSIGIEDPERVAVAILAGYKYGGGSLMNALSSLKSKQLVQYLTNNRICLTNAGIALAKAPENALTTQELHNKVMNLLSGPERKILQPILSAYPEALTTEELAQQSGYESSGGSFSNAKSRLRTLGLVEYPEPGKIVAKSILFI